MQSRKKVAIIGAGVVGMASARGFEHIGHDVVISEIDKRKHATIQAEGFAVYLPGQLPVEDVDVFFISVPTPTVNLSIDLSMMDDAVVTLAKQLGRKQEYFVVAIRSTVLPGTTEQRLIPVLERYSGKRAGYDFGVCMNPEYLRAVSADADFLNPRLVVIGALDQRSFDLVASLYEPFGVSIKHFTPAQAEFQKYVHNCGNAVMISLFNDFRMAGDAIGLDQQMIQQVFEVTKGTAEAFWNSLYGVRNLGPFDGACLPKDTQSWVTFMRQKFGYESAMVTAAIKTNQQMKNLGRPLSHLATKTSEAIAGIWHQIKGTA